MFTKIKEVCFNIAMLGGIGAWYGGGFIASLLAVPTLFFLTMMSSIDNKLYSLLALLIIALAIVIIYGALHFQTDKDPSYIVLDRAVGLLIGFLGISLNLKFFIVGFLLFHCVGLIRPLLINKIGSIDLRCLPGVLGVVTGDIIAGVTVNFFFRMVMWLTS